jgi:uncharacterized protein
MKAKMLHDENGLRTFAIVFDKGDEVRQGLLEFANTNRFADAHLTGIGAFSEVTLGFFDPRQKTYKKIDVNGQVEVLSFIGNIVQGDGKPRLHAHVVVGKSDGTAHGGHFLGGRVWPTLEIVISEMPVHLRRTQDEESGLALINLAA